MVLNNWTGHKLDLYNLFFKRRILILNNHVG